MSKKLIPLILALSVVATAQAHDDGRGPYVPPHDFHFAPLTAAPEIDPASATSAFTLLAGGLVLIRGRRRSSK